MNVAEANDYLDLLLDKADQPYFTDSEKEIFLNLSITEFINKYYDKIDFNSESRTALTGLYKIVVEDNASIAAWTDPNRYEIVDGQFMYPIAIKLEDNEAEFKGYKEYIEDVSTSDPFNKSDAENPSFVVSNFGIVCNPAPTTYFRMVYLFRPTVTEVFDDSKIQENYQVEILNIAARKMLANIENPSYEMQINETERGINQ
tara:strand:- start:100 stop:705 length:606 start_codon:yes stop_codon:yes gene_type:complete